MRRVLLLLLAVLAAACSAPAPPAPAGSLSWSGCEAGFECASLPVSLDGGRTLDLAVTRHRATGDRVGSLVVNPGGPGISAVDSLQASWTGLPPVLAERFDLVAVDPRGVGRSSPVRCGTTAELDRFYALDPTPDDRAEQQAYEQGSAAYVEGCRRTSGALLGDVSTAAAAEDLDRLRAALGDERLTYLGYSYGTAIGAAYLDAHPRSVRAMVLDGALDPTLTWDALTEGQAAGFDAALSAMLEDCERTRCRFRTAVSGDLGRAYDDLAARVDAGPLPAGGGRRLGPGEMTLAVGEGLYDEARGWPRLAAALAAAERGDGGPLLAMSDDYLQRGRSGYSPALDGYNAVSCLDRPWPRDPAAYRALAARLAGAAPRFGPAIALAGTVCATWPVPAASTPHPVRAPGAPPVLVIGTTGDPATPYAWAVALAEQLDSGVLLTHRGEGHTVYGRGAPECITGPVEDYLVREAPPAPSTC